MPSGEAKPGSRRLCSTIAVATPDSASEARRNHTAIETSTSVRAASSGGAPNGDKHRNLQ
jgi:hypothetical protein